MNEYELFIYDEEHPLKIEFEAEEVGTSSFPECVIIYGINQGNQTEIARFSNDRSWSVVNFGPVEE